MKKIKIAVFIIISAVIILFASCAKDSGDGQQNSTTNQAGTTDAAVSETEAATQAKLLPNVPEDANLNGYKFRIIYNDKSVGSWGMAGIEAAEENGDVINDAAYARNTYVTEKYNFQMAFTPYADDKLTSSVLKKIIQSGADDYDLIIVRQYQTPSLITSGAFVDLNTVPYIDIEKPWWDKSIINQMSIGGKKFAAFGDFIVGANDAIRILMFNKKLHKDFALEDIYTLVNTGKWTLDKFYDMGKNASADLDGNGVMDKADQYALLFQQSSPSCFMFGADEAPTSKDANDLPVLNVGNERLLLVLQKTWDIINSPNFTLLDNVFTDTYIGLQAAFENNQGLFYGEVLQLAERMRAGNTDFGVIPYPKYDESQENYFAFADSWCTNQMFIPASNRNIDKTGEILEILNAESYYTVRPAYYDKSLNGKFMRDEESSKMLDIILANKVISLDEYYGWGMYGAVRDALTVKSPDFTSAIDKNTSKVQKAIDKTVTLIQGLQ